VFNYIKANGENTDDEYAGGPYVAASGTCTIDNFY